MKNRWQDELRRELKPVRVSENLKIRILAEAERAQFRRRRQRMAMAAVAAVLVAALGLTAALANLRPSVPDRRSLSDGSGGWVWVSPSDSLYHARRSCGGLTDAQREELSRARAEGRTACPACISAPSPTAAPTDSPYTPVPDDNELPADMAATPEPTPMPTAAPDSALYTPVPDDGELPADVAATPEPTPMPTLAPEEPLDAAVDELPAGAASGVVSGAPTDMSETGLGVWMTENGTYYHLGPECSGMKNASLVALEIAEAEGRPACPVCVHGELLRLNIQAERAGGVLCIRATAPDQLSIHESSEHTPQDKITLEDCVPLAMNAAMAETLTQLMTDGDVHAVETTVLTVQPADDAVSAAFMQYDDENRTQTLLIDGASASAEVPLRITADRYSWQPKGGKLVRTHDSLALEIVQQASSSGDCEYLLRLSSSNDGIASCQTTVNEGAAQALNGMTELWFFGERYVRVDGADSQLSDAAVAEALGVEETWLVSADESGESGAQFLRIDETPAEEPLVYMTENGTYYHTDEYCSGMQNAFAMLLSDAQLSGKEPCPTCVGENAQPEAAETEPLVFTSDTDEVYHYDALCPELAHGTSVPLRVAEALDKTPCPACAPAGGSVSIEAPANDALTVFMTPNGQYFHIDGGCSGMQNAHVVPLEDAQSSGKQPCPTCIGAGEILTAQIRVVRTDGYAAVTVRTDSELEWLDGAGEIDCPNAAQALNNLSLYMNDDQSDDFRELLQKGAVLGFRASALLFDPEGDAQLRFLGMFTDCDGETTEKTALYAGGADALSLKLQLYRPIFRFEAEGLSAEMERCAALPVAMAGDETSGFTVMLRLASDDSAAVRCAAAMDKAGAAQALPSESSPMTELALDGRRYVVVNAASAEEATLRAEAASLLSIDPALLQIADALPGDDTLLYRLDI